MEYPIYIDGIEKGKLLVGQEGIRTRFTAKCEKVTGIVRLFVFGGNERAYLGVLCPENDGLALSKSFSRSEMRKIPEKIEYAANEELKNDECELLWHNAEKGCLVAYVGGRTLVAIPADEERLKGTGLIKRINDGFYLVFRK